MNPTNDQVYIFLSTVFVIIAGIALVYGDGWNGLKTFLSLALPLGLWGWYSFKYRRPQ